MAAEDRNRALSLDPEAMRAIGYRTVDMLVRRLSDPAVPPLRRAAPAEMRERLGDMPPTAPRPFEEILARLEEDVLPFASRGDHPGFVGFIPFAGTWPGALGDFIAAACNIYAGSWMESAGPTQLELEVLGWFKEWIGYPAEAGGILTSGGSISNLSALACARESLAPTSRDVVGYAADQAHHSIARGARMLGLRPDQLRVLPTDGAFRLDPQTLAGAMEADTRAGRQPLFVCATAGTTNTGAIDPLPELAELCRERSVWLHVDAAYGGFAALTKRGRSWLRGIELADSVTLDPHKLLYQPYECGCLLVRDERRLRSTFQMAPDYLQDAEEAHGEVNMSERGLQLTRSSRAIKVWVSLQFFGVDAFGHAIDHSLDVAERARERIEQSPLLELTAPSSLGVVCFRRRFPRADEAEEDRLNAGLVSALERSGLGLLSSTTLAGRRSLRICILSHTTGWTDVEGVLDFLEQAEPERLPAPAPSHPRDREMRVPPLRRRISTAPPPGVPRELIDRMPLFTPLDELDREHVAALAALATHMPGEKIVQRWETDLDFYVIVDGRVEVRLAKGHVRGLGPGDFFGELGALDWGAGYGYARTASIVALTETTVAVFPQGALNELMRDFSEIAGPVRRAAAARLREQVS